jgi:ADP-ribose pyrophosphatase YjhB (NUDIX family)
MHLDERVLAPVRARYGEPRLLRWEGEITEEEFRLATYNPERLHDVTLFIWNGDRLALIRKPRFAEGVWRTPGGGVKPGEDFAEAVRREGLEETGAAIELERYLLVAEARFTHRDHVLDWRTHVFSARTDVEELAALDTEEISAVRWGTAEELLGPVRARLLETGRAFWRYRVALHDAVLEEVRRGV